MPVKKVISDKQSLRSGDLKKQATSKKAATAALSLRAPKGRGNLPRKIASPRQTRGKLPRNNKLSVPVYSLAGKETGTLILPKEIFGVKVNEKLLVQAARVYLTNQSFLPGFTKTRGEVEGSTAKIYRQKGTGRARHGAIRAPIFVGGGITFGPKPRKVRLNLPQKMKKAALLSALSAKAKDAEVVAISGLEKASGKTKEMVQLLKQLSLKIKDQKSKMNSTLIITGGKQDNVVRAVRNIPGVDTLQANVINAYEVLKHDLLFLTKEAIAELKRKAISKK